MNRKNSTDCDTLFAAFAELLDNALDEVIEHLLSCFQKIEGILICFSILIFFFWARFAMEPVMFTLTCWEIRKMAVRCWWLKVHYSICFVILSWWTRRSPICAVFAFTVEFYHSQILLLLLRTWPQLFYTNANALFLFNPLTTDNGGGMAPDKMRQCMSLGYSAKSKMANTIGQCELQHNLHETIIWKFYM